MEKCNYRDHFFCKKVISSSKTLNFAPKECGMKKLLTGTLFLLALMGCEHRPSMLEQRKAEIRRNDSTELAQARVEQEKAERDVIRLSQLVDAYKKRFVFEKEAKYQTVGYWVLPAYKGSKERFSFFPEVEESGKLLLVSINQKREYSFTEVDLSNEDYESLLPKGLSAQQRKDVGECFVFAKTMQMLDDVQKYREKMQLKVRFYEEKQKRTDL